MNSAIRCTICYRDVRATLAELHIHCDAYHYGQSPDLIFGNHGLHYKPLDLLLKRQLVERGEQKMGKALISGSASLPQLAAPAPYVVGPVVGLTPEPAWKPVIESRPVLRVVYTSTAWETLVCQGWVTVKTELTPDGEIATMEKY